MSEHVVGRVTGTRVCLSCSDLSASGAWECCPPNDQCPCCLSAELTALRAAVERVRELPAIQIAYPDGHVRDMVELAGILAALDGAK